MRSFCGFGVVRIVYPRSRRFFKSCHYILHKQFVCTSVAQYVHHTIIYTRIRVLRYNVQSIRFQKTPVSARPTTFLVNFSGATIQRVPSDSAAHLSASLRDRPAPSSCPVRPNGNILCNRYFKTTYWYVVSSIIEVLILEKK